MTTKSKAEKKKNLIRIGALLIAGVMMFSVLVAVLIK
jgi:hypothetical protein